jgi:hypothetical protein
MGGRAFIWLKGGCTGPKSTKQVEVGVADLPTILRIAGSGARKTASQAVAGTRMGCADGDFRGVWLIPPPALALLSRSQF